MDSLLGRELREGHLENGWFHVPLGYIVVDPEKLIVLEECFPIKYRTSGQTQSTPFISRQSTGRPSRSDARTRGNPNSRAGHYLHLGQGSVEKWNGGNSG